MVLVVSLVEYEIFERVDLKMMGHHQNPLDKPDFKCFQVGKIDKSR